MHYGGNFSLDQAATTAKFTKYYSEDGSFEVVRDNTTGQEKHLLYIGGTPYESNIVYVKNYAEIDAKPLFLHKDYLGTILAITDEKGKLVEERHFDAWGNLTHGSMQVLDRGYTSHEHLQDVGLIHMNGRLYDPMLRRFLNADENIQDPTNTQCYNKYGYVMNNPLMFNDPSGEYGIGIGIAITIGVIVAALTYTANVYFKYGNLKYWNIYEAHEAMFWGAVSAAATYGVGTLFSAGGTIVNTIGEVWSVAAQAAAHGIVQGVLSSVQGGNFWSAALSGTFGSLGASAFGAIGGDFAKSTVGTITFGAISGGVGAELSGGNFWQGVVIGGIVAGLNHTLHKGLDPKPKTKYKYFFKELRNKYNFAKTINGDLDSVNQYYYGDSKAVNLGVDVKNALLKSGDYTRIVNRLVTGVANKLTFKASVDLTFDGAFFVGRTTLFYDTKCNSAQCTTYFKAFEGDGFWDPLDIGLEIPLTLPSPPSIPVEGLILLFLYLQNHIIFYLMNFRLLIKIRGY
ncbi:RHS repeat domain-containing protein [Flavobacterium davisii]|nr:RHS repeat-associated core domain-containing protein [Flavobacterium davisii]